MAARSPFFADNGYFSVHGTQGQNGYISTHTPPGHQRGGYFSSHQAQHTPQNQYFFLYQPPQGTVNIHHHPHRIKAALPRWIDRHSKNAMLPQNSVIGGYENGATFFVCRGYFNNTLYPGKLANGFCYVADGGREIELTSYQVLVATHPVNWVARQGTLPDRAIYGSEDKDRSTYICQAGFAGGMHPGRLQGQSCHITHQGEEITIGFYNVLTV